MVGTNHGDREEPKGLQGDWNEEGCEMRPRWRGSVGEREGGERESGRGRGELGK